MMQIDLNADLDEGFGPWSIHDDAGIVCIATSVNIACGGHAGDPETMSQTLEMARDIHGRLTAHGVHITSFLTG